MLKHKSGRPRHATLKAFRVAHDLSQREAAKLFGVSQMEWSRWERGIHRPGKETARRLIAMTGVPLEVLMGLAS